jgi:hypothetical protein
MGGQASIQNRLVKAYFEDNMDVMLLWRREVEFIGLICIRMFWLALL